MPKTTKVSKVPKASKEGIASGFKKNIVISAIVAAFLLTIANSAIWVNQQLFNTTNFTQTAVSSVTSESSRRAIASEITDRALADYPSIKNVVDDYAINFISGLLGSDRAEKLTTRVVSKLQIILTSKRPEPIVINLEGLKTTIGKLIEISGREGESKIDPAKIPSEITVLDTQKIPSFYQAGVVMSWLSPFAVLGAIALLAIPYFKNRKHYASIMLAQSAIIFVGGLFMLLIGPLFKPQVLANINSANMRVVVGNLYDAFIATFNSQTYVLILLTVIVAGVSSAVFLYRFYKSK